MKLLLHPTISPSEAKRLAVEHGCLLVMSGGGRLRLKQRRHHRGIDGFEMKAIRHCMSLANRSFALLELGNYRAAQNEIRQAVRTLNEVFPESTEL